jgi:hypothetical protein
VIGGEAYQRRCSLAGMGCRYDHWHRPDIALILRDHTASITDEMDRDPDLWPKDDEGNYNGDLRVCACGLAVDGFYEYTEHLIAVFGGDTLEG